MKPARYSLLTLLAFSAVLSVYATIAKKIGLNFTAIGLITICAVVVMALAIRIYFFDR